MTIAVTGGSGKLARLVVEHVLRSATPERLVVTTRNPARLADLAARGVDVRRADFDDPSSLPGAFRGVERLLLVSTDGDTVPGLRLAQHRAAVEQAARAGVAHIVYTSLTRAEPGNPLALAPDHIATEEALRASGASWTALRNNVYSDGVAGMLGPALASGTYVVNSGSGGMAHVAREDCARVAGAVLLAEPPEHGAVLEVSGPEAVSAERLADLVAETTGRRLRVVQVDDDDYVAGLMSAGFPPPLAQMFASFGRATREGWLGTVSTTVRDLTGREPVAVRDVLARTLAGSGAPGVEAVWA